ncbi:MAG: flagellar hook-associated protein FlgK [Lachnospiraceae bacterium]|nr:flagellar hook-associated protein FlgK [Lachnospiraceae bacterium]
MPLMGSLYIGASGLQTGQNALNTTAHNLSNMETVGYVRQQVQQGSRAYVKLSTDPKSIANKEYGLGVSYTRVKQVRDYFLDKTYRRESGRSMFYEVSTEVMEEVESQLGEMNGEAFQNTIEDFWTSIQELAKDPASSVTQGLMVQRAEEFVLRATAVYDGLCSYQDNLNVQIKQYVDKINAYGKQLTVLNDKIREIEAGNIEHANDLRDSRNQLLDELSEMANMNFGEDVYGNIWVQIEGVDFVKGDRCYQMEVDVDPATGFYTPFWLMNATYTVNEDGTKEYNIDGAEVFDLSRKVSTDLNTDIGGLKAMLLARGDHRADYTDITEGKYDDVSQSVIMNIQAEFDQLIHNVAVKVNEILGNAAGAKTLGAGETLTVPDADGNMITLKEGDKYWEVDSNGYMRKDDGSPIQMFTRLATDGYRKVTGTITDAAGNTTQKEYWIYNPEVLNGPNGTPETETLYSVKNLQVDPELAQKPAMLGFRLEDGSEDKATAEALKAAFMEENYTLNPNVKKKTTFVDYYTDLVSQIANTGYVNRRILENQQNTVEATESARQQVIGVSSDEELSNMIRFQNAYNASSRYINVVDEMLEHILSTLGA